MDTTEELTIEQKAAIYDEIAARIETVRKRYERPCNRETFNGVYSNGVLAGLSVVEADFNDLTEFVIDDPHFLDVESHRHLVDDRPKRRLTDGS